MDMERAEIAEHDSRGGKAEGDVVGQGVELLANRRTHLEGASGEAVEEIKHGTHDDACEGNRIDTLESEDCSYAP